ncbi:lipase family protein [Chishuiella sp.]|uniref:lipase family protein n=1 Tax=Chishuiella sp. TaxID=1969467 RepID=UPI0028AA235F|nr:hypothetical protein [Chishuiella sp.]
MEETYLKFYAILKSSIDNKFTFQSKLIKTDWLKNDKDNYIILKGKWKDNSFTATKENYFVLDEIDGQKIENQAFFKDKINELAIEFCKKKKITDIAYFDFFAGNSKYGYEYPIVTKDILEETKKVEGKLNYDAICRYALASEYVYHLNNLTEYKRKDDVKFIESMGDYKILETFKSRRSSMEAISFLLPPNEYKKLKSEIVVAIKGTTISSAGDLYQDFLLSIQNVAEYNIVWQEDAAHFVEKVLNMAKERNILDEFGKPNVILTGHSLGAYTAMQTALRYDLKARVFAGPGVKVIDKYFNSFSNTIFRNSVLNFVREGDPVVKLSGRHEENMIYFPTDNYNPIKIHGMSYFIDEVFPPFATDVSRKLPSYIYCYPSATLGAGLIHSYNNWGKFN